MGPHIINTMWPLLGFRGPIWTCTFAEAGSSFWYHYPMQSCQNLAAKHNLEQCFYTQGPRCLCVTAFQMVHFQIACHTMVHGVISHSYTKWDVDSDPTSTTATGMRRNSRLRTLWQMHILWQWVRTPTTLTTTKAQCEGCSIWFHFISSDADNWKCSTCSMYWCHYVTIHCFE